MKQKLPDHPDDVRMSFGDHLEELRSRLIKAVLGLVAGTAVCTYFGSQIFVLLTTPYVEMMQMHGYPAEMVSLDPTETFLRYFQICLIFGIGLSAPFAVYQLWQFVAAGLYPNERRWVTLFAPASMALFFAGVLFLIKIVLPGTLFFLIYTVDWVPNPPLLAPRINAQVSASRPASMPVLAKTPATLHDGESWISREDGALNWVAGGKVLRVHGTPVENERLVKPMYSLAMYLDFVNGMCLAFGLGFQIPIVVVLLVLIRVVTTEQLTRLRKLIVLLIIAAGALLTPSGDVSSQLLLAVPMVLLFEAGLFIAKWIEARRTSNQA